jgi:hypothetical protein
MRVEIKQIEKKPDGIGVGFLLAFGALLAIAYVLAGPEYNGRFPLSVERALANYRAEVDNATIGVRHAFANAYAAVAGR